MRRRYSSLAIHPMFAPHGLAEHIGEPLRRIADGSAYPYLGNSSRDLASHILRHGDYHRLPYLEDALQDDGWDRSDHPFDMQAFPRKHMIDRVVDHHVRRMVDHIARLPHNGDSPELAVARGVRPRPAGTQGSYWSNTPVGENVLRARAIIALMGPYSSHWISPDQVNGFRTRILAGVRRIFPDASPREISRSMNRLYYLNNISHAMRTPDDPDARKRIDDHRRELEMFK